MAVKCKAVPLVGFNNTILQDEPAAHQPALEVEAVQTVMFLSQTIQDGLANRTILP